MNLVPFTYAGVSVRVVEIDNEPWFAASDITPILGYQHGPSAIRRLDPDEYRSVPFALVDSTVRPGFGPQNITVVSESGAYSLILWSQKEEAKPFRRWITTEVLPTIRKHGAYMSPAVIEQTLTDPDFIIRLATDLKVERARNAELAAESERRRAHLTLVAPKADAFDLWLSTNINYAVGTVAKALCAAGADSGRTKLFDYMAELGWIFKAGRQWEPYQSQINNGRLAVKLGSQLNTRTGEQFQTVTVRITPKGATALATRYGVMPETVADLLAADPEAGAA